MAQFVCSRCGKCCMSLGKHLRIERSISSVQHYCRNGITRELIPVMVQASYRDLYSSGARDSSWCPFLRQDNEGMFTCTVYETRPRTCREFRCRTIEIYNRAGQKSGYVAGKRTLVTDDPLLKRIWQEIPQTPGDDAAWIARLEQLLGRHGFRAELLY